ncbi:hypothetical protein AMS68_003135 [Peltaster fructicola]|uniref:Uncharacterized protein n=1 Tax=Peltaster fructicola TaxID=286661 RepID=A0A6H0XSM8_9PEZI|nr:hypothetical protein AMS68_003135 [Peltaster fructicola]
MAAKYDTHTTADVIVTDLASEIAGKVILTTGVSPGGLGAFFVEQISQAKPSLLILAGRSTEKLRATADNIGKTGVATRLLQLDLTSFAHVKDAAAIVNGWSDVPAIDVLVNNAGVMAIKYEKTVDGHEKQFATNHLGPFLFTNLIMPKIMTSKEPRIVTVSSDGHRLSPLRFGDYDFHDGDNYNEWLAYGQSKTANMLMTLSLAQKLGHKGLTAISLHPGVIGTNLGSHIDWKSQFADLQKIDRFMGNFEGWKESFDYKTPERGVATHVFAAFSPELKSHNAAYVLDSHIAESDHSEETIKSWATNPIEAEMLWKLSERLVDQQFLQREELRT